MRTRRGPFLLLLLLPLLLALPATPPRAQEPGIVPFEAAIAALQAQDPGSRSAAARELAFHGRAEAVPALLAALAVPEPSPWVRKDLYGALGALGDPAALPALVACLQTESRIELLGACVAAMGQIGDPAALPYLLPLATGQATVGQSEGEDGGGTLLRLRAIDALGLVADAGAVEALAALLDNAALEVRRHAAGALARQGGPTAAAALRARLRDATDTAERAVLVAALGAVGADAVEAVPSLARLLAAHQPPALRHAAADALGRIGGPAAVAALITLLGDEDPLLERRSIVALGQLGDTLAAGPLMARFAVGIEAFHRAGTDALLAGSGAWERELEALTAVLQALVRLPPLGGAGYLERAAAGRPLPGGSAAAVALKDAQHRLRMAALAALGKLPRGEAAAFLAAFAADAGVDPRLRGAAARALGAAGRLAAGQVGADGGDDGSRLAREALEGLLADGEREVRWSACLGLAALGDPAALPALEALIEGERDALVLRAAAEAATALSQPD